MVPKRVFDGCSSLSRMLRPQTWQPPPRAVPESLGLVLEGSEVSGFCGFFLFSEVSGWSQLHFKKLTFRQVFWRFFERYSAAGGILGSRDGMGGACDQPWGWRLSEAKLPANQSQTSPTVRKNGSNFWVNLVWLLGSIYLVFLGCCSDHLWSKGFPTTSPLFFKSRSSWSIDDKAKLPPLSRSPVPGEVPVARADRSAGMQRMKVWPGEKMTEKTWKNKFWDIWQNFARDLWPFMTRILYLNRWIVACRSM